MLKNGQIDAFWHEMTLIDRFRIKNDQLCCDEMNQIPVIRKQIRLFLDYETIIFNYRSTFDLIA